MNFLRLNLTKEYNTNVYNFVTKWSVFMQQTYSDITLEQFVLQIFQIMMLLWCHSVKMLPTFTKMKDRKYLHCI